jgi:hypothetical protein
MTALKHGTVTVRAVDALGFTGTSGSVLLNDFNVSFPDTSMNLTDTIDVPIAVGNVTSFGIVSFEGRFAYDSTVVRVLSMPTAGTLSSGFSVIYKDTLDTVRVAAAGPSALTGGGILLKVRVRSVASSVGASSPLRFTSFMFNEGLPTATAKNGSVRIGTQTRVHGDPSGVPQGFLLEQNFPNPFNPTTEVRYTVPVVALSPELVEGSKGGSGNTFPVSIKVYDLLGREIATLVNEAKLPGTYEVVFDAGGLASGVYLYRMEAGSFVQTKKLVLLR